MSKQWVMILAVAIVLGLGLIWLLDYSMPGDADQGEAFVLPAMAEQINDISALDIVAPGGAVAVSLRRTGESDEHGAGSLRWRVVQRDGYEADFARVFELLRNLAELEQTEARTSNPDWYVRLGVQPVGEANASGRQLNFPLNDVSSLIVGQVDPTGQGSYVRVEDQAQSWLADRVLELPVDPVQWLEPGIMNIPASDIEQIIVRHPDGETVQLRNAGTENDDFVLLDVPEDRTAGPAFQRTSLANGLRGLNLEDVRSFNDQIPENAVRVLFTTNDGLNFIASVFEQLESEGSSSYWIHFNVSAEGIEQDLAADETQALAAENQSETEQQATVDQQEQQNQRLVSAVAVDARLSPWLYQIPERRFSDLTRRIEDLLEPLPETEPAE